jgi:hypothetical protein
MTPDETINEMKGNSAHLLHQLDQAYAMNNKLLKINGEQGLEIERLHKREAELLREVQTINPLRR